MHAISRARLAEMIQADDTSYRYLEGKKEAREENIVLGVGLQSKIMSSQI